MNQHPYRLRPYHNPNSVDESKVPAGWRFRYADEMGTGVCGPCIAWLCFASPHKWSDCDNFLGIAIRYTYIVPVA